MNFILINIAGLLFAIYVIAEVVLFGLPRSISESYYLYDEKKKGLGYLFTVFMYAEAFLIIMPLISIGEGSQWQFVGFLCPCGLAFCGTAVLSKGVTMESRVHCVGAYTAAVMGLLWCFIFIGWQQTLVYILSIWTLVLVFANATNTTKYSKTFWIEIATFGTIMTRLLEYVYINK